MTGRGEIITRVARLKLQNPGILAHLGLSFVVLLVVLNRVSRFLDQVELRPGVILADPLLARFAPIDLTWVAFGLIYGGLLLAIFHLMRHPERLILAMQSYSVMVLFRVFAMYLLPLDPPPNMIVLKDPFVEFFGSSGQPLTRDLFFSGHTSTMFLLYLTSVNRKVRGVFLVGTAGIAACVLLQHVHYSIDVLAAPFFAYGSMRLAGLLNLNLRRLFSKLQSH